MKALTSLTIVARGVAVFAMCSLLFGAAVGQEEDERPTLEELRQTLEQQMRQIEEQSVRIESQQQQIEQQQQEIESQRALLRSMQTQLDQLAAAGVQARSEEEIAQRQELESPDDVAVQVPEEPTEAVTVEEIPGSFRVPGTNASVKFGGYVRMTVVATADPIGTDDRFVVGTIPPKGAEISGDAERINLSARASRLNIDLREDTKLGQLRAFVEGDFGTGDETFRQRHAYGQFRRALAGQTWSTFVDSLNVPDDIDFEGLSGRILVRQPQIRFFPALGETLDLAVALEDPAPDVAGGTGVSRIPDLVARVRRKRGRRHVQGSVLLRQIRAQPDTNANVTDSEFGWGVSLSGRAEVGWTERDNFLFQLNVGDGIGRYINDLGTVGGKDGAFNPSGELETYEVFGGYVAFQHWWKPLWRSTFVYSYVGVNNLEFELGEAYKRTQRATINFLFSPIPRIDLGAEFLWGGRTNRDGSRGTAFQTQMAATYRF